MKFRGCTKEPKRWRPRIRSPLSPSFIPVSEKRSDSLDYARNDKDPGVRQWAVEGLRFLAKDDVLDELFTSFTEDPSMKVRDRPGCNIADCGIFTRKQRMRMVPKLINLAANSKTNAQLRSWSFLALQEITDVNVPADVLAWNRWYADHGAEKMAEFERLEWWQVHGDE